jgi:hypothetical protein
VRIYKEFDTWQEAFNAKKDYAWISKKQNNKWLDVCEECKE